LFEPQVWKIARIENQAFDQFVHLSFDHDVRPNNRPKLILSKQYAYELVFDWTNLGAHNRNLTFELTGWPGFIGQSG